MGQGIINSKNATRIKGVKYAGTLADGQVWVFDSASGNMIPGTASGGGSNIYTADGTLGANRTVWMTNRTIDFNGDNSIASILGGSTLRLKGNGTGVRNGFEFHNNTGFKSYFAFTGTNHDVGNQLDNRLYVRVVSGSNGTRWINDGTANPFVMSWGSFGDDGKKFISTYDGLLLKGTSTHTLTPSARLHVIGNGATSGTTALLVQNSAGTDLLEVKDDGTILGAFPVGGGSGTDSFQTNGVGADASGLNALSFGKNSDSFGSGSISFGNSAKALHDYGIAIGESSKTETGGLLDGGIAIGLSAVSTGRGICIGTSANTTQNYAIGIGQNSDSFGESSIALGNSAKALDTSSIAIGESSQCTVSGFRGLAIGVSSNASGSNTLSIGSNSGAANNYSLAIGSFMRTSADGAIMIGHGTTARTNATADSLEVNFNEATSTIRLAKSADSWINTSANFGIGHAAPTAKLHVLGSTLLDGNLGVFGTTPIAQPTTGVAPSIVTPGVGTNVLHDDTFDGYTLAQIVKIIRNLGLGA